MRQERVLGRRTAVEREAERDRIDRIIEEGQVIACPAGELRGRGDAGRAGQRGRRRRPFAAAAGRGEYEQGSESSEAHG